MNFTKDSKKNLSCYEVLWDFIVEKHRERLRQATSPEKTRSINKRDKRHSGICDMVNWSAVQKYFGSCFCKTSLSSVRLIKHGQICHFAC